MNPKSGRLIGFEIFDKTNFGVTDFAEKVNFRRALEGELERSVMALSEVEQARVHFIPARIGLHRYKREPAKASVLVKAQRAELPEYRRFPPSWQGFGAKRSVSGRRCCSGHAR